MIFHLNKSNVTDGDSLASHATTKQAIGDETRLNDPVKTMKVAVGVDVPRFLNEFMTRISGLAAKAQ